MSVAVLARCWPLAGTLPPVQWIALAALADAADDDGWTWIGNARLAHKLGRDSRDVRRLIEALAAAGLVDRVPWEAETGRSMTTLTFVGLGAPTPPPPHERGGRRGIIPQGEGSPGRRGMAPLLEEGNGSPPHSIDPPEGPTKDPSTPRARPRNEVWDALEEVLGWSPATDGERKRFGRSCRTIREALGIHASVEPGEHAGAAVRAVAAEHRKRWPTVTLTLESMVKHWSDLYASARARQTAAGKPNRFLDAMAGGPR